MAAMQIPAMKGGLTKAQLPSFVVLTIAFTIGAPAKMMDMIISRYTKAFGDPAEAESAHGTAAARGAGGGRN